MNLNFVETIFVEGTKKECFDKIKKLKKEFEIEKISCGKLGKNSYSIVLKIFKK